MEATIYIPTNKIRKRRKTISTGFKYKIFIVEDNQTSQMLLANYLYKMPNCPNDKRPNLAIYCFESGEECLAAMKLNPDIVILDFYLDEMNSKAINGLNVLKQIKTKRFSPKVIIMSSQESVMVTSELYNQGASDYISKEHYAIARVEQSVLRLISEIKNENKKKNQTLLLGLFLILLGVLIGSFI